MIAIGCDHGGYELKEIIAAHLKNRGVDFMDVGCHGESVDYPDYAQKVCEKIQNGECERGIVICGTGIGISIAANKMHGIRCALCADCFSAKMSREHNDANVLALGGRVTGAELAKMIVDTYLDTTYSTEKRHHDRVAKIMALEGK